MAEGREQSGGVCFVFIASKTRRTSREKGQTEKNEKGRVKSEEERKTSH